MPLILEKPQILRKQPFNLIGSTCHPHDMAAGESLRVHVVVVGDVERTGVCKPPPAPNSNWLQFAGGRAGRSNASREVLQTTDKLYTLP